MAVENVKAPMSAALRQRVLIWTLIAVASGAMLYFIVERLKFESQLDNLKLFCGSLITQSSVEEIQISAAFTPGLKMVLLEPRPDGSQIGSIYFDGSGRGGCSMTFMRGRLTQKSFFFGVQDPTKPGEKLKPW